MSNNINVESSNAHVNHNNNQAINESSWYDSYLDTAVQKIMNLGLYCNVSNYSKSERAKEGHNELLARGAETINIQIRDNSTISCLRLTQDAGTTWILENDMTHMGCEFKLPQPKVKIQSSNAAVLFFQGAGGMYGTALTEISRFWDLGFEVWVFDYPGMGESEGQCNRDNILEASKAIYSTMRNILGDNTKILLFSNSMGCGPVSELAAIHKEDSISILMDCPNAQLDRVVNEYVSGIFCKLAGNIASWAVTKGHNWSTADKISQFKGPLVIFRAEDDKLVLPEHAEDICNNWNSGDDINQCLITVPGGHWGDSCWRKSTDPKIQTLVESTLEKLGFEVVINE